MKMGALSKKVYQVTVKIGKGRRKIVAGSRLSAYNTRRKLVGTGLFKTKDVVIKPIEIKGLGIVGTAKKAARKIKKKRKKRSKKK